MVAVFNKVVTWKEVLTSLYSWPFSDQNLLQAAYHLICSFSPTDFNQQKRFKHALNFQVLLLNTFGIIILALAAMIPVTAIHDNQKDHYCSNVLGMCECNGEKAGI